MTESLIADIAIAMADCLDCIQMKRLKAVLKAKLTSSSTADPIHKNVDLLACFLKAKRLEGCSQRTLDYYKATLEKLADCVGNNWVGVSTEDLRHYLADYQDKHSTGSVTMDNIRRIFSSFFSWLEDEDYIAKSPVRRIHRVKTPTVVKEVITDEQLEMLRDGCDSSRNLAIIDLLATTGMRVGELVRLNREDVDFNERECIVLGKGDKQRKVYFDARAKLHLQQYLNERDDESSALFVTSGSHPVRIAINTVETGLRNLGKNLCGCRIHPHKFRRTVATSAIDKGMPIEQVQKLLGHARIDTTMQYALVNQSNVKASHRRYLG